LKGLKMKGFEHYKSIDHISPSSLSVFSRCPRKYFYQIGCRLQSPVTSNALLFGEAMHYALPHAYEGDIDKAFKAFNSIWKDAAGDDIRNSARAMLLIENFTEAHSKNRSIYIPELPPKSNIKVTDCRSAYELDFAIDIGENVPFVGRIDCVARHRDTRKLVAVEYKTASRLGNTYLESFRRNPQVIGYALALEALARESVDTVYVEVLPTQKTQTHPVVIPVNFLYNAYEPFIQGMKYFLQQIRHCEEVKEFPQNICACNSYSSYGMAGYNCPYLELCELKDWTLGKDDYTVNNYNPFIIENEKTESD
jgi:hypothetical protein